MLCFLPVEGFGCWGSSEFLFALSKSQLRGESAARTLLEEEAGVCCLSALG